MPLAPAADIDAFARAPAGRYTAGDGWLHFCSEAGLFGALIWGGPDEQSIAALVASLRVELGARVPPHRSLVDVSRLVDADSAAFGRLLDYVNSEREPLSRQVTQLALVRPEGLAGAVVAGFYEVADSPYPVRIFDDCAAALRWLGHDAALSQTLTALHAELVGEPPLVSALQRVLAAAPGARMAEAARRLGTSGRTLQRRLRDAGTSYQRELTRARVAEAKRRLQGSDAPLTNIALDLGFASLSAFSALFRREVGLSPSRWRRERGGGTDEDDPT